MQGVKVNAVGKIIRGEQEGWYVKVLDDRDESGGFFICECSNKRFEGSEGFDTWLESPEDVVGYFEESSWQIEWPEV